MKNFERCPICVEAFSGSCPFCFDSKKVLTSDYSFAHQTSSVPATPWSFRKNGSTFQTPKLIALSTISRDELVKAGFCEYRLETYSKPICLSRDDERTRDVSKQHVFVRNLNRKVYPTCKQENLWFPWYSLPLSTLCGPRGIMETHGAITMRDPIPFFAYTTKVNVDLDTAAFYGDQFEWSNTGNLYKTKPGFPPLQLICLSQSFPVEEAAFGHIGFLLKTTNPESKYTVHVKGAYGTLNPIEWINNKLFTALNVSKKSTFYAYFLIPGIKESSLGSDNQLMGSFHLPNLLRISRSTRGVLNESLGVVSKDAIDSETTRPGYTSQVISQNRSAYSEYQSKTKENNTSYTYASYMGGYNKYVHTPVNRKAYLFSSVESVQSLTELDSLLFEPLD